MHTFWDRLSEDSSGRCGCLFVVVGVLFIVVLVLGMVLVLVLVGVVLVLMLGVALGVVLGVVWCASSKSSCKFGGFGCGNFKTPFLNLLDDTHFLSKMVSPDPQQRPTAEQVVVFMEAKKQMMFVTNVRGGNDCHPNPFSTVPGPKSPKNKKQLNPDENNGRFRSKIFVGCFLFLFHSSHNKGFV